MSEDKASFLSAPMRQLTAILLRRPWTTFIGSLVIAAVAVGLTAMNLGYKSSRTDLLNPHSDYNKRWLAHLAEFGDQDDAVIVVEGRGEAHVLPVLKDLAEELSHEPALYKSVLHEVDLSPMGAKGLYFLPTEQLLAVEQFVSQTSPISQGEWSNLKVGQILAGLAAQCSYEALQVDYHEPSNTAYQLQQFCAGLRAHLEGGSVGPSLWPEMTAGLSRLNEFAPKHLLADGGRLGLILLKLDRGTDDFAPWSKATDSLRVSLKRIEAKHRASGIEIGLTGLPIMENDEMRASQDSMYSASVISFVAVALIFIAGFGGFRHALMANLVLLIGMAWAFGYVTLSIGHLNILSVSFAVTLIGIGIDYGVYYVARYMKTRENAASCEEALLKTTYDVGPAIATGAATTAIAFFAAGCTSFAGVAELGIIAGGGILLCAVAQLFVLPSLLMLVDRSGYGKRMPVPLPVHSWVQPLLNRPKTSLLFGVMLTVGCACGLQHLWYDHNLLNMQARDLDSVRWERRLLEVSDQSSWFAVASAGSPAELLALKAKFEKLERVQHTEEIVSLLPPDQESKRPIIERIAAQLKSLPNRAPVIPVDTQQSLGRSMLEAQEAIGNNPILAGCSQELRELQNAMSRLTPSACVQAVAEFQQRTAAELIQGLQALAQVAHVQPPSFADLSTSLTSRFVGSSGQHLLRIYGRGDIWDMEGLEQFVSQVRSVDPNVTGNPLQAYEASLEMKGSYETAAMYALAIIMGVLLFDFRSIRFALLAALPLALGMLQTFGLLGLLNIPLNPANMIALPLILGIGVDYGVHMVHEFREQSGPYKLSAATAVAVLVDALTTIVGFGSLMIASHQGLQSLGRVLTLGITCCTLTSLVLLPALLTWMSSGRPAEEPAASVETDDGLATPLELSPAIAFRIDAEEGLVRPRRTQADNLSTTLRS